MKRILLPTDFSENAWHAIDYGRKLFASQECQFFVLNAFQIGSSGLMTKMNRANQTRLFQITKAESEAGLKKAMDRINQEKTNPKHSFKTICMVSTLVNAVAKSAYEEDIDFIVMGTKGATGLKEVFLGSNTVRILKKVTYSPIIVVPDDFKSSKLETILFVTGFEHLHDTFEIRPMANIAKFTGAKIKVLYVGDFADLQPHQIKAKELIHSRLKGIAHEVVNVTGEQSISASIKKAIDDDATIGMVAMIDYWHSFMEKLTHEPVVKKIAFNSKVPFLVMHLFE
ncbi:MAG: universal stress protein [Croceitalea sp.]|nr:universal stress protein [Croceitalea sp.]